MSEAQKPLSINLNTPCTFTLTPRGAAVWNAKHAAFWTAHPEFAKPVKAGVEMREPIWRLMHCIGDATYMGSPPCIEDFAIGVEISTIAYPFRPPQSSDAVEKGGRA